MRPGFDGVDNRRHEGVRRCKDRPGGRGESRRMRSPRVHNSAFTPRGGGRNRTAGELSPHTGLFTRGGLRESSGSRPHRSPTPGPLDKRGQHQVRPTVPSSVRGVQLITQRTRVQIPPPRRREAAERRPFRLFYLRKQLSCCGATPSTPGFLVLSTVRFGQHQT
jgi:hypothetical protein